MSKHTPGRWYWDFDRDGNWSLRSDSADAGIMDQRNCPLIEDRILIESAPDILEALEFVQGCLVKCLTGGEVKAKVAGKAIEQAALAIARAKGESS